MLKKPFQIPLYGVLLVSMILVRADVFGEEPVLTLYVARHAQRGPRTAWPEADREKNVRGDLIGGKAVRPSETSISPFGEKQCELLGAHLRKLGFKGKIYASPSYRTMQTAVCTASAAGFTGKIIPEPGLQEGGNRKTPAKGMSAAELRKRFPDMVEPVELPERWKLAGEFTNGHRIARMTKFLQELLAKEKSGEILLVGHSSTLPSLIIALNARTDEKRMIVPHYPQYVVNCCLYRFKLDKNGKVVDISLLNYDYLPENMMTNNFLPVKKLPPPKKFVPAKK